MPRVVTVTLNPAVDLSGSIARLAPERKLRCERERRDPGGGGVNVARVVDRLGGEAMAIYARGGPTGQLLDQLLAAEGLDTIAYAASGDTRQNVTIFETTNRREYRFVFSGAELRAEDLGQIKDGVAAHLRSDDWLVLSGSIPPGAPADAYAQLARAGKAAGARVAVDASGAALKATLGEPVSLIKPNLDEMRELTGQELRDMPSRAAAAQHLARSGAAEMVAVTMGGEGAMLATDDGIIFADALRIETVSSIGAGDSFLGALIWALAAGREKADAVRYATAAGAAALLTPGTSLCERAQVEALYERVKAGLLTLEPRGHS